MKLLDPFAGIKLATGHPLFHFAFFIGSFAVEVYSDPSNWCTENCDHILESQNMERKCETCLLIRVS